MTAPDPTAASRRRASGPAERLELADVVGEHHGRWAQVRAGITTGEEVRADIEAFRFANPAVTRHVTARRHHHAAAPGSRAER